MVQEIAVKMASLSDLASHHLHHHHHQHHHTKITKAPRGSKMVKPILKKLASSPKNSLDLDRGWEEQPLDLLGYGSTTNTYESGGRPSMSPSMREAPFHFASWDSTGSGGAGVGARSGTATPVGGGLEPTPVSSIGLGVGAGMGLGAGASVVGASVGGNGVSSGVASARTLSSRSRFQHVRSTSATSHVSIATNGSSHRPGASFVHPFQQTPRTNTPPLTYATSFTSFERDNGNPTRDYSPTIITENDDDELDASLSHSLSTSTHLHKPAPSNTHSTASLRRPSLASQRTSSLSDMQTHHHSSHNHSNSHSSSIGTNHNSNNDNSINPPLRVNTTPSVPRSVPSASSRFAHGPLSTSYSNSDLHLTQSPTDSPRPSIHLASPGTSTTPATMSPLRTSLEGAFRLRSRSEVDTGARREDIREARRKFEENERIKQEKYEAEQRRKLERRQEKERAALAAAGRKNTGGSSSEMASIGRPSFSRKRTPPPLVSSSVRRARLGDGPTRPQQQQQHGDDFSNEKMAGPPGSSGGGTGFLSSNYESTEDGAAPSFGPDVNDVRFETPKRAHTAKRRTQSYWTSFVLWFRTRLLKIGRR